MKMASVWANLFRMQVCKRPKILGSTLSQILIKSNFQMALSSVWSCCANFGSCGNIVRRKNWAGAVVVQFAEIAESVGGHGFQLVSFALFLVSVSCGFTCFANFCVGCPQTLDVISSTFMGSAIIWDFCYAGLRFVVYFVAVLWHAHLGERESFDGDSLWSGCNKGESEGLDHFFEDFFFYYSAFGSRLPFKWFWK